MHSNIDGMSRTSNLVEVSTPAVTVKVIPKFLLIFIPTAVLLFLGSLTLYYIENNTLRRIIQNQEIAVLDKQEDLIKIDFQGVISDLLYLATQSGLHSTMQSDELVAEPNLAKEFLEFARYKGIYDQVRLLDGAGMEKTRINYHSGRPKVVPDDRLQFKGRRYYFADTIELNHGEVFVSPFDLNIEKGEIERPIKPMIRFGTPVFDANGEKKGAVVLNYLGAHLTEKLRVISNTVPGANLLLNSDGYLIVCPDREDEWGFMYADGKDRTYRINHPIVWRQLQTKESGQFKNNGALYTYNTIYPLKEDVKSSTGASEAFAPSAQPIAAADYYWILLSVVPKVYFSEQMRPFVLKLALVDLLMLGMLGIGCWMVSSARAGRERLLIEKQMLINELQGALANIRTLSGLIPICASCKSIRDDKGYWKRIESYIGEHSEAEFSHSICPDCSRTLYPDLYLEKE